MTEKVVTLIELNESNVHNYLALRLSQFGENYENSSYSLNVNLNYHESSRKSAVKIIKSRRYDDFELVELIKMFADLSIISSMLGLD